MSGESASNGMIAAAQPPAAPPPATRPEARDISRAIQDANAAVADAQAATARGQAAAVQVDAALAEAREAVAAQAPGQAGNVSVVKDATGKIIVQGRDGRTITIDPAAGLDEDAIQEMVQTALEPPRPPEPPRGGPPESVMIVSVVFSFLLLMTLVISVARVLGRRAAAGAAGQGVPPDLAARLGRIEQAVEAVAIEVERVSEAQRYSARLLTERLPNAPALGAPAAAHTADVVR